MQAIKKHFGALGIDIVRDAETRALGIITGFGEKILAPLFDARFAAEISKNPCVSMVLTTREFAQAVPSDRGLAVCSDPESIFFRLHARLIEADFYWTPFETEIARDANIHPSAFVAERNVKIGKGVIIGPMAVVHERTIIGDSCVIGSGTVLGEEGCQVHTVDGRRIVIPHAGGVKLASHVTIKSNCAIDRSLFGGFTEIGEETVLDNLVHVAHAVVIGKRCSLLACSMLSGSIVIGDDVRIGPNATVSNSLSLGDRARVTLGAVVTRDVPADGHVSGNFAVDHKNFLSFVKSIR